jgi:hypothetical protein
MTYARVEAALARHGLSARGGFHPGPADRVPPLPDGQPAQTLVLAGNVGPAMWRTCAVAPEFSDGGPDPLDRWSRRVLESLAAELRAAALFPFGGPPYHPFVPWAKRAEPVGESPLGILIHPDHGLWHAYRGALALRERIDLPPTDTRPIPCRTCADKPCLSACPVGAFTVAGYDVPRCVKHISTEAGADCMGQGCRARRACPVGRAARYDPAQSRFHMEAFLRARSEA